MTLAYGVGRRGERGMGAGEMGGRGHSMRRRGRATRRGGQMTSREGVKGCVRDGRPVGPDAPLLASKSRRGEGAGGRETGIEPGFGGRGPDPGLLPRLGNVVHKKVRHHVLGTLLGLVDRGVFGDAD